jgi:hypothetical protein
VPKIPSWTQLLQIPKIEIPSNFNGFGAPAALALPKLKDGLLKQNN